MRSHGNKGEVLGTQIALARGMRLIGLSLIFALGMAQSQPVSDARPRFEVASVKRCRTASLPAGSRSGGGGGPIAVTSGRVALQCFDVAHLINIAYVQHGTPLVNDPSKPYEPERVREGPSWIRSNLYDIAAKADGNPEARVMLGPMLQVLLEERFQLKLHRGVEQAPMYALTVAKSGLKMKPMEAGGCIAVVDPAAARAEHPSFFAPGEKMWCNFIQGSGEGRKAILDAAGVTLRQLAASLSNDLDRFVADRTGISDRFNFHLEFDNQAPATLGLPSPPGPADVASAPSVFSALDQLGLKLISEKGPHGFIVIDHVAQPQDN